MKMDPNAKISLILTHKLMSFTPAAAAATLQLMGAGLDNGTMDEEDCADIIKVVFDKKSHEEVMGQVDAIMAEGGTSSEMVEWALGGSDEDLFNEMFGDIFS